MYHKQFLRILSLLLAAITVLSVLPAVAIVTASAVTTKYTYVKSLSGLETALADGECDVVVLEKDIEESGNFGGDRFPMIVNGTKTLDLAGHDIDIGEQWNGTRSDRYTDITLFDVQGDLTVDDSTGKDPLIRFNAYAWSQAKTIKGSGDYDVVDIRNVFRVRTGAKLTVNAGEIQAGRCKTQYITGGTKGSSYEDRPTTLAQTYNANATFVIRGSAVKLEKGSTFIMNGGSLTARDPMNSRSAIEVVSFAQEGENLPVKIVVNNGYLFGKAGANIFSDNVPETYSTTSRAVLDLTVLSGFFETEREEVWRGVDDVGNNFSDSCVYDGVRGNVNLPSRAIKDLYSRYCDVVRTRVTIEGDSVQTGSETFRATGKTEECAHTNDFYFTDTDLRVIPLSSVSGVTILNETDDFRGAYCPGQDDVYTVQYVPFWTDGVNESNHTVSAEWKATDGWNVAEGGSSFTFTTDGLSFRVSELESLCPSLYEAMVSDHREFRFEAKILENFNGYHDYLLEADTQGAYIRVNEHAYTDIPATDTADCTHTGTIDQICALCGGERTVESPKLGHVYNDTKWYEYNNYNHVRYCIRCGEIVNNSQEPHDFSDPVIVRAVSCTGYGMQEKTCRKCGLTVTQPFGEPTGHRYKETGQVTDYVKNGSGHWKVCQVCSSPSEVESHTDGNSDGVCDVCNFTMPLFMITVEGHPSWHSVLHVEGSVETFDMEQFKTLAKKVYDLQGVGGTKLLAANRSLNNFIKPFRDWLSSIDASGDIVDKFDQMVTDYTHDYDQSAADNLRVFFAYSWYYNKSASGIGTVISESASGSTFGRTDTLDLSIKQNDAASTYDRSAVGYISCRGTVFVRNSVTKSSAIGAGYYQITSDTLTIPAMTYEYAHSATCTDYAKHESWICPTCGDRYAFYSEDSAFTVTGDDGISRSAIGKITNEEYLINSAYPPLGHLYNPVCGDTCSRCGYNDPTDKHESSSDEYLPYDSIYHALVCDHCGEAVAAKEKHELLYSVVTGPTCTSEGLGHWVCSVCGYEYQTLVLEKTAHRYEYDAEQSSEGDCFTDSSYVYVCADCGHMYTSHILHNGHHIKELPYEEQHCYEDGHIHAYFCTACNKYFSDEQGLQEISAESVIIPHDEVSHVYDTENWVTVGNLRWHECVYCDAHIDEEEYTLFGDVDGNGVVDITDVSALLDALASGTVSETCNLNGDATVDITDVSTLLDYLSGN